MQNLDELKKEIVKELEAEGLKSHEQDELITTMTDALLERATLELISKLPEDALAELNSDEEMNKDPNRMLEYFEKFIPNVEEVMKIAFREGIEAYKKDLNN